MACVNVVAADTDEGAQRLATSLQQLFLGVISGKRKPLQPPVDDADAILNESEMYAIQQMLTYLFVGGPATIEQQLQSFLEQTQVNEVMVTSHIYDHPARLYSYKLFAEAMKRI